MFRTGQKVLCIDGNFPAVAEEFCLQLPQAGKTYTIRSINDGLHRIKRTKGICVRLEEITNPPFPGGDEPSFDALRFREHDLQDAELEESLTNLPNMSLQWTGGPKRAFSPLESEYVEISH